MSRNKALGEIMTAEAIAGQAAALVHGQGQGLGKNAGPRTTADEGSTQPTSSFDDPAVEVDLSEDAQSFLNTHGNSAGSTAHRARAAISLEGNEALAALPFGKVVSALAHGLDPASLLAEPEGGESTAASAEDPLAEGPLGEDPLAEDSVTGVPSEDPAGEGDAVVADPGDGGIEGATYTEDLLDILAPNEELPTTLDELIADILDPEASEEELPPTIDELIDQLDGDTLDA